jgi:hypothetical protein
MLGGGTTFGSACCAGCVRRSGRAAGAEGCGRVPPERCRCCLSSQKDGSCRGAAADRPGAPDDLGAVESASGTPGRSSPCAGSARSPRSRFVVPLRPTGNSTEGGSAGPTWALDVGSWRRCAPGRPNCPSRSVDTCGAGRVRVRPSWSVTVKLLAAALVTTLLCRFAKITLFAVGGCR